MRRTLAVTTLVAALAACSTIPDAPTEPRLARAGDPEGGPAVTVCHRSNQASHPIEVALASLPAHLAHGDYVARLLVDPATAGAPDGVHFARITEALLEARAGRLARSELTSAACRITIAVAAGTFVGSFDAGVAPPLERFPLLIDVPDLTLLGAFRMQVDAEGRATGEGGPTGEVTTLVPDRPLTFQPVTEAMIVVAGHPGGSAGHGTVIAGFSFQSGRPDPSTDGGMGIISLRVRDLVVRGNRFEAGLSSAGDHRETSARAERNYGIGLGLNCAFCFAGPGTYEAEGNRLVQGRLGGFYVTAAVQHLPFSLGAAPVATVEPGLLPAEAAVSAALRNNLVERHRRLPVAFGVRILALGPGTSAIRQDTRVVVEGNELSGNTFGIILDAGFPMAGTLRRGDLDVTLSGNAITGSCQRDLLVAFTRHTGALGTTTNPFLAGSTYRLALGGDLSWADAWFSHPPGLGNTLTVDGATITPGAVVAYNPSLPCP